MLGKTFIMKEEEIFQAIYNSIVSNSPNILSAIVVIVLGVIVGKIVGKIVEVLTERLKVENMIFRKKVIGLPTIFSFLISWSIYLIFLKAGIDFLGIAYISQILEVIVAFLGKLLVFLVFFLVGLGISMYLANQIERSKIEFKTIISRAVLYSGVYITLVLTLPIFGIDTTLLSWLFIVIVASILIPFSFGLSLALKDEIKAYLKPYLKRKRKRA